MNTIIGIMVLLGMKKLFSRRKRKKDSKEDRKNQTIFKYPEGGYGLDDDPVTDELLFLMIIDD